MNSGAQRAKKYTAITTSNAQITHKVNRPILVMGAANKRKGGVFRNAQNFATAIHFCRGASISIRADRRARLPSPFISVR
jgi:hypothetical protein